MTLCNGTTGHREQQAMLACPDQYVSQDSGERTLDYEAFLAKLKADGTL
jgi:hypothetical protein